MATQDGPGARIMASRDKSGWSRRQVADALGVSYQRLADIERDRKPISLELILRIAEVLLIDPATIDDRLASRKPTGPGSRRR